MSDEGDKNRKRRRVDKKDSNDDGVIEVLVDLTSQSKSNSLKIHDVVDLTAPVAPKPVQSSQQSMGGFKPKTFGDCDIVSTKDDKLFDDDIVIVVSDAYREKKREERRNKAKAPAASSSSSNLPSTSAAHANVSAHIITESVPVSQTTPSVSTTSVSTNSNPAASTSTSNLPPPTIDESWIAWFGDSSAISLWARDNRSLINEKLKTCPRKQTFRETHKIICNAYKELCKDKKSYNEKAARNISAMSNTLLSTTSSRTNRGSGAGPSTTNSNLQNLTVSSVITAVAGAMASLATPASSSSAAGTTTSSNGGNVAVAASPATGVSSEFDLWVKFRSYNGRKEYLCPCARCRGRSWYLTFDTVSRHCRHNGYMPGWVPASSPGAPTSPCGLLAIAAGGQANRVDLRPPAASSSSNPPPRPGWPLGPPPRNVPSSDPVITDNRPGRSGWRGMGHPIPGMNTSQPPAPARPPATTPSLDNLPTTVPDVVDNDPNPLTCPVCLDSKAQIQASNRTLVSTTCGHVFCSYCIEQVYKSTKQCPQCRKKLNQRGWHPLYI